MLQHILERMQAVYSEPLGLVFALVLGTVSAVTSACCTLPAMALLVGYSSAQANENRRAALKSALFFTLGLVLALMIIGGVAGFIGQVAQAGLGRYWKIFAGIAAVFLGLATLKLLPFQLSWGRFAGLGSKTRGLGSALAGIVLGGMVAVSSLPCNPGIFIVIGAALLRGQVFWAVLILAMFAIGFSLPLGALLLGISLSKVTFAAQGADTVIRWVAGSVLLLAGFYFLLTR